MVTLGFLCFAPDDGIFHRKNLGNFNLVVTSWGFVFWLQVVEYSINF